MSQSPDDLAAVAALDEPTRRGIYDLVVASPEPLTRDEVAAALELPRSTAAFHLDRLVDERLLDVAHIRTTGRTGPGAGRPAKHYRRSSRQVNVSLPPRHYDLAGRLLAGALEQASRTGKDPLKILERQAHKAGVSVGRESSGTGVIAVLRKYGFEPRRTDGCIELGNCPFQTLAADHPEAVCGMNLHLLKGLLEGLSDTKWSARLEPGDDLCCVRLHPRRKPAA